MRYYYWQEGAHTEFIFIYVIFVGLVSTSVPLQCVISVSGTFGTSEFCVSGTTLNIPLFYFWLKEILFVLCPPRGEAAGRLLWVSFFKILTQNPSVALKIESVIQSSIVVSTFEPDLKTYQTLLHINISSVSLSSSSSSSIDPTIVVK